MIDGSITTRKVECIKQPDEKEIAQKQYDEALAKMLAEPTKDNIDEFSKANEHLYEVEDLYRIAIRLLTERAKGIRDYVRGLSR